MEIPRDIHAWYDMELWLPFDEKGNLGEYLDLRKQGMYKSIGGLLYHEMGHYVETQDQFVLDPFWGHGSRGLTKENIDREMEVMWISNVIQMHCEQNRFLRDMKGLIRGTVSPALHFIRSSKSSEEELMKVTMDNVHKIVPWIQKWDIQSIWNECQRKNAVAKSMGERNG